MNDKKTEPTVAELTAEVAALRHEVASLRASRTRWRWLPVGVSLLLAAATAVGIGGVARASIPDSGGTIHACYSGSTGSLRVIDLAANQSCKNGESPLSWGQGGGGLSGLQVIWNSVPAFSGQSQTVTCPSGKVAIGGGGGGGGWITTTEPTGPTISGSSGTSTAPTGWTIGMDNITVGSPISTYAVCVNAP